VWVKMRGVLMGNDSNRQGENVFRPPRKHWTKSTDGKSE
jgi:hypothetical protein